MNPTSPIDRRTFLAALAAAGAASPALADPGVNDREIVIGQFAAFSGPAAELGRRMQLGIQAHFKSVNDAGGVRGRLLRLVTRDDAYEPEKSVVAVKALIEEDQVFALIGSVGTPTTLAALPFITAAGVPLVGPFTGAQALREPLNRQVFHVRASYFDETERIVQHLTTVGIKRIAVFYQNDSYGKAGLEGVTRALDKRGLKAVAAVTVERNSVDVAAALAGILKTNPEVVVQVSAYKSCAALIRQARAQGYRGQFFNLSFVGSQALADELGDAGVGVTISQVVPFPYTASTPLVRQYQQRMKELGSPELDFTSFEGYLAALVLVEGLMHAGRLPTRESMITAMESFRDVRLAGYSINFTPTSHEGSRFTDLTFIAKGRKFVH